MKLMQLGDEVFNHPLDLAQVAAKHCSVFGKLMLQAVWLPHQAVGTTIVSAIGSLV